MPSQETDLLAGRPLLLKHKGRGASHLTSSQSFSVSEEQAGFQRVLGIWGSPQVKSTDIREGLSPKDSSL